jgi:MT0933-like antitoxin protein
MSMIDKIKSALKGREDKVRKFVEKAGDTFNQKTGNKYEQQVNRAQEKINDQLRPDDHRPEQGKS